MERSKELLNLLHTDSICFGNHNNHSSSCSVCVLASDCYIDYAKRCMTAGDVAMLPEFLVSSSSFVRSLAYQHLQPFGDVCNEA